MSTHPSNDHTRTSRPSVRRGATLLVSVLLLAGCSGQNGASDATPTAPPEPNGLQTLSPDAAAIPELQVDIAGRKLILAGYDPSWSSARAEDVRLILQLAPYLQLARGETYPVTMRSMGSAPVIGWLPPDFGHVGGSAPAGTPDGFVPEAPESAFVRADALPDFEAGLFGVTVETEAGARTYAYPVWIQLDDVLEPDAFAGLRIGIADEDGSAAALTFIEHIRQDLERGGGPEPKTYPGKDAVLAAFDAGDIDAYISIPAGWSAKPTTHNGFQSQAQDPVEGNEATDTGDSYRLASLIDRALGTAGLVYDRGY